MLDENEIIQNIQSNNNIVLATVTAIGTTGLKLKLDGSDEAGDKEYKANMGTPFAVNDRVVALKVSGSYIVLCAIGKPNSRAIPSGGSYNYVLKKSYGDWNMKWARDET